MKQLAVTNVRGSFLRTTGRVLCVVLLLSALPAVPVGAAPARSTTLNATTRQFTWHDGPRTQSGLLCNLAQPACSYDDTLIKLTRPGGRLTIRAVAEEDLPDGVAYRPDIDLYLHRSNANGDLGRQVTKSETQGPIETVQIKRAPTGYYLVRVSYYSGAQMSYDGKATWKPRDRRRG
jgi:hypothetical protein